MSAPRSLGARLASLERYVPPVSEAPCAGCGRPSASVLARAVALLDIEALRERLARRLPVWLEERGHDPNEWEWPRCAVCGMITLPRSPV